MKFDIAVILINYNSSEHSINCIKSIIEKTSKNLNFQIIITDNCSEKEDYLKLKNFIDNARFSNLELHRNNINSGFGGGNMFGVQFSNATYYAFINNDTLFLNDCLLLLKSAIEKDNTIAAVGGQCYKLDGEQMLAFDHFDSLTKELLGRDFLEKINPKKYPNRKKTYTSPLKVNYVQGSFMLINANKFNIIGGFDTNIFLYYEETDLCKRLEKNGGTCYLIPEVKYIHHQGVSTPKNIYIKTELKISLLYVIRKHYGYFSFCVLLNYLRFNYLISSVFKPKYGYLLKVLFAWAPLSKSLKTKQKIDDFN